MNSLLMAVIHHLQNDAKENTVTVHVLNALSELTLIGGLEIVRTIPKIFPRLIFHLQDSTSLGKREVLL